MIATKTKKPSPPLTAAGRALIRAAKATRKTAKMHGTPIYVSQGGKIIALRP